MREKDQQKRKSLKRHFVGHIRLAIIINVAINDFCKWLNIPKSLFLCTIYIKMWPLDQVSISSTFYIQIFRTNVVFGSLFYVHVTREKLQKRRKYKKFVRKMLMKLTAVIPKVCFADHWWSVVICGPPNYPKWSAY
jgi:hypothetical protein